MVRTVFHVPAAPHAPCVIVPVPMAIETWGGRDHIEQCRVTGLMVERDCTVWTLRPPTVMDLWSFSAKYSAVFRIMRTAIQIHFVLYVLPQHWLFCDVRCIHVHFSWLWVTDWLTCIQFRPWMNKFIQLNIWDIKYPSYGISQKTKECSYLSMS